MRTGANKIQQKRAPREVLRQEFLELQDQYHGFTSFYTDGSKTDSSVGCAVIGPGMQLVRRINDSACSLTAELYGLLLATDNILKQKLHKSIVYTDSLSALRALARVGDDRNPLVIEIRNRLISAT